MKHKSILLCLLVFLLTACIQNTPEYVDFSKYKGQNNQFIPLRETISDIQEEQPWNNIEDSSTPDTTTNTMRRTSPRTVTDVARSFLEAMLTYKVHQVAGTYRSVDVHGDSITVSGKFFYPENGVIKNLMIVSHYTIGANHEAPSETFSIEGLYAGMGYGVLMADYIGYGITVDSVHPYLQAETTAHNVIDMAIAIRPFIAERGLKVQSDSVILLGYSQGGAATLHVMRVLENSKTFKDLFAIKKVYAGAGPYDIAQTYDYCVKIDKTGIPCAIPLIIQGMSLGMDKPLDMAFFFKEPLLTNYPDWINSKRYTVNQMSKLIGVTHLSDILTANGTDRTKRETARFYAELSSNSVPKDFIPKAPLYMFHSEDDETVPFINSQIMQRQFREKNSSVEYNFGHYGSHMKGAIVFLKAVAKDLKK